MERRKLFGIAGVLLALAFLPVKRLFQYLETRRGEEHERRAAELRAKGSIVVKGFGDVYLYIENADPELLERWGHPAPAAIVGISDSVFVIVLSPTELIELRRALDVFLPKLTSGSAVSVS